MSEKEVREYACHKVDCAPTGCTCGYRQALSEPPDVAAILRWIDGQQKRLPMNTPVDADWYSAFKIVRHHIEQQFHVRLTDDGWKWVEDGE